jgi:hypothetical protein
MRLDGEALGHGCDRTSTESLFHYTRTMPPDLISDVIRILGYSEAGSMESLKLNSIRNEFLVP